MRHYARAYLSNEADVEDILSNCWVSLIQQMPQLSRLNCQAQKAYIMQTLRHEIIDFYRRRDVRRMHEIRLDDNLLFVPESGNVDQIVLEKLSGTEWLAILSKQERMVAEMKLSGASNAEIADQMQLSQSTVRVYWFRGLQRIRAYIEAIQRSEKEP